MRHLKLRELQADGVFEVQYRTPHMLADLFTKTYLHNRSTHSQFCHRKTRRLLS